MANNHPEEILKEIDIQPWQFLPVQTALKNIVESMFILKVDDFSKAQVSSQFYYPWSAKTTLFFTISDEAVSVKNKLTKGFVNYEPNFIMGPNLVEQIVQCPNKHHVVGITFTTCGLQFICDVPVIELTNQSIDASFILGKEVNELSEKLKEDATSQQIHQLVETFLLKKVISKKYISPFDLAINELIKYKGNIKIDEVANLACLSSRQLERYSLEKIGVAPKLFARLTRFSNAYLMREAMPLVTWSNIAHNCGYFDQMHLIRDFKQFAGYPPSTIEKMIFNSISAVTAMQGAR